MISRKKEAGNIEQSDREAGRAAASAATHKAPLEEGRRPQKGVLKISVTIKL
jgi:hypothetical protein